MVKRTLAGRPAHANLVPMERTDNTLYDDDFYAWTQEQAALLRRLPAVSNRLDAELIAEEIEDLGRSEVPLGSVALRTHHRASAEARTQRC